jgi:hypothetical protein
LVARLRFCFLSLVHSILGVAPSLLSNIWAA